MRERAVPRDGPEAEHAIAESGHRGGQLKAKDLLRASELPLLRPEEASVRDDLKKIAKGKPPVPFLLGAGWTLKCSTRRAVPIEL